MKKILSIAISSLFFAQLQAEEFSNVEQLLAMDLADFLEVKVATGTTKQVSDAPAIVSVVTADDIQAMGARTLSEALEHVPGLHVGRSLNRLTPLFSVRGIFTDGTPQILVLIDGVSISELTALSVPYAFHFPVAFVERIEIIRGPGSAVYGADAFSGVINIITKSEMEKDTLEFGTRIGSFDHVESWLQGSHSINDLNIGFSVTVEQQNNDSDRLTPYGVMQRNREMTNLHLNLEYGNWQLKNWYWEIDQLMGVGAGIFANDIDKDVTETWRSQLSWQNTFSEDLEVAADVSFSESNFDATFQLFPPGTWPVGADGNIFAPPFTPVEFPDGVIGIPSGGTQRFSSNASFVYSGIENHRLRIGFGLERSSLTNVRETKNFGPGILDLANIPVDQISDSLIDVTGTPYIYSPEYDRDLWYVSVQDEWNINDTLSLTAGIRFDDYNDFGSTINPRLALVWQTTEALSTKILYGTAFRAPKVAELAFINNPTTIGNPDVEPEEIETIELGFDYRPTKSLSGKLNLFYYESKNLIEVDQSFTFQNIGEQKGQGGELELQWQAFKELSVKANFSYLKSELPLADSDKERVPGLMANLDVRYQLTDNLLLSTQNYWIADRVRAAGDLRPAVDNYLQTDVNLIWRSDSAWSLTAGIKNVFNAKIVEPVPDSALFAIGLGFPDDYPMESRSVFVAGSYRFE